MLAGEAMPGMNSSFGFRLQAQTHALEWLLDDLLVICGHASDVSHLAISCKSNVQVTASGLPHDFVSAAWKQFVNPPTNPMRRGLDCLALVTRGRRPAFQAVWSEIKNDCASSDPALALARIQGTKGRRIIFDNIKKVAQESSATVSDEDVLEFIRHLLVVPKDFDLDPSEDRESAIAQCRQVLTNSAPEDARDLWNALVNRSRNARLGNGTIDLLDLWHELRTQFKLKDHPDFSSDWQLLRAFTREHLGKIETTLPSGYSLARIEASKALALAILNSQATVLYGDSGTGKSALVKSTLEHQLPDASQIWLDPEMLKTSLSEIERIKTGFAHPLLDTLMATTRPANILVIDAAEHIGNESTPQVKQLVKALLSLRTCSDKPTWRVLTIGQTEAWADGRLQSYFGDTLPIPVPLEPASSEEVKGALQSTPQLSWLALQDDAVPMLANLRALAWVMQAAVHFKPQGGSVWISPTTIADSLWKFWTKGQLPLQKLLIRLALREASFEHSFALSELADAETHALQERPSQLPLRTTSRNRVEFQHDLAAEWARYQRLKEISDDTEQWAALAQNPLWTGALRMLGQFLLREPVNNRTAWDIAFEKLNAVQGVSGLAIDILLDALCLDPLAESLLSERADILFANHGALLNRLLVRFHHIATVPNRQQQIPKADPSLSLYIEAQHRVPIVARWPAVIRFLSAHRDRVATLMSPAVSRLCERWLTTLPVELSPGVPVPYRKELAEIALSTARVLQVAQGKRVIFGDDSEKPIYTAALSGAPDIPDEVSEWVLEMAQRKPWRADIIEQIAEYQQQQAIEHTERLRTDPEHRQRRERLEKMPTHIPSGRELPPWLLGPHGRVEHHFSECCTHSHALIPLMRSKPDVAAEVLLATIIEDSPKEEYGGRYRFDDDFGLAFDQGSYPTAYWKSPFYAFLQVNPEKALGALIALVDFCTERWDYDMKRHGVNPFNVALTLKGGTPKEFVGNHMVFDWAKRDSTHTGQLHSALVALEKWLCDSLENGTDVSPYIERLLGTSHSVAFLGVLLNVGKFRAALFQGLLRPLLGNMSLYIWDSHRIDTMQFDAFAWVRQGEMIFQMAQEWHSAAYRKVTLRELAAKLVAFHPDVAEFIAIAIEQWMPPENEKNALEFRTLKAELDRNNYIETLDSTTGQTVVQFSYPEALVREVQAYQSAVAPDQYAFSLPMQCDRLLSTSVELTSEQAEALAKVLSAPFSDSNSDLGDDEQRFAQIAAASTLLARARPWLDAHKEANDSAKKIVQTVVDQIDDGIDLLRNRMLSRRDCGLEFVAHAVMQEFISSKGASAEAGNALLRILTSGDEAATRTLALLAYEHRRLLGPTWWRLLELSLLWCGLVVLTPRPDEPQSVQKRWCRWLRWLRSRELTDVGANQSRVNPLAIARRVERLQRRHWVREFARKHSGFGGDPSKRQFDGLDTHLLKATFTWIFQEPSGTTQQLDATDAEIRFNLLKSLLDFELWPHTVRREDDRDEPPTNIGYEILPAIVNFILGLPEKTSAELWQPIFQLGGSGHYILGHFISCWLQQVPRDGDLNVFARHWRAMIEYALASPQWSSGRQWFNGERLMCRLLGCGSEPLLDQVAELQTTVSDMRNLYESWAHVHLERDEENIAYFCGFLSSSTGSCLRLDGIQWLNQSFQIHAASRQWRRSGTAEAMINLLDVILTNDTGELASNVPARDAWLGLMAMLVKKQVPAALALQERAKGKLSGRLGK